MHKSLNQELFIKYLETIGNCYVTGNFEPLFPYLAANCVWESQWRLTPEEGKIAVENYYRKKGKALRESPTSLKYMIVQFIDNYNLTEMNVKVNKEEFKTANVGLYYQSGKLALFLSQKYDDYNNATILDLTIDDGGMISRIDMCMPELFKFVKYEPYYSKK